MSGMQTAFDFEDSSIPAVLLQCYFRTKNEIEQQKSCFYMAIQQQPKPALNICNLAEAFLDVSSSDVRAVLVSLYKGPVRKKAVLVFRLRGAGRRLPRL